MSFTSASSPAAVYTVHTGSILFEVRPDTEAIISAGNVTQSRTGTASWAAGQDRTLTVTTSGAHGLTDQYNRVYITGASNNAINGFFNEDDNVFAATTPTKRPPIKPGPAVAATPSTSLIEILLSFKAVLIMYPIFSR